MTFTTLIDNSILDRFWNGTAWTGPTNIYAGFSSTTPNKGGTGITEPSTGAYARQQITTANVNAAASSSATFATDVTFPVATADYVAGANLTYIVLWDAATAGTVVGYILITNPKPILNGDTAKIVAGDLALTMA